MNANQIVGKLVEAEMIDLREPDARRVIRDERMRLQAAVQSGDAEQVAAAMKEAVRVAGMWGVTL